MHLKINRCPSILRLFRLFVVIQQTGLNVVTLFVMLRHNAGRGAVQRLREQVWRVVLQLCDLFVPIPATIETITHVRSGVWSNPREGWVLKVMLPWPGTD